MSDDEMVEVSRDTLASLYGMAKSYKQEGHETYRPDLEALDEADEVLHGGDDA